MPRFEAPSSSDDDSDAAGFYGLSPRPRAAGLRSPHAVVTPNSSFRRGAAKKRFGLISSHGDDMGDDSDSGTRTVGSHDPEGGDDVEEGEGAVAESDAAAVAAVARPVRVPPRGFGFSLFSHPSSSSAEPATVSSSSRTITIPSRPALMAEAMGTASFAPAIAQTVAPVASTSAAAGTGAGLAETMRFSFRPCFGPNGVLIFPMPPSAPTTTSAEGSRRWMRTRVATRIAIDHIDSHSYLGAPSSTTACMGRAEAKSAYAALATAILPPVAGLPHHTSGTDAGSGKELVASGSSAEKERKAFVHAAGSLFTALTPLIAEEERRVHSACATQRRTLLPSERYSLPIALSRAIVFAASALAPVPAAERRRAVEQSLRLLLAPHAQHQLAVLFAVSRGGVTAPPAPASAAAEPSKQLALPPLQLLLNGLAALAPGSALRTGSGSSALGLGQGAAGQALWSRLAGSPFAALAAAAVAAAASASAPASASMPPSVPALALIVSDSLTALAAHTLRAALNTPAAAALAAAAGAPRLAALLAQSPAAAVTPGGSAECLAAQQRAWAVSGWSENVQPAGVRLVAELAGSGALVKALANVQTAESADEASAEKALEGALARAAKVLVSAAATVASASGSVSVAETASTAMVSAAAALGPALARLAASAGVTVLTDDGPAAPAASVSQRGSRSIPALVLDVRTSPSQWPLALAAALNLIAASPATTTTAAAASTALAAAVRTPALAPLLAEYIALSSASPSSLPAPLPAWAHEYPQSLSSAATTSPVDASFAVLLAAAACDASASAHTLPSAAWSVRAALAPRALTPSPMLVLPSLVLAALLARVPAASASAGAGKVSEAARACVPALCAAAVADLERAGMWEWSVFVANRIAPANVADTDIKRLAAAAADLVERRLPLRPHPAAHSWPAPVRALVPALLAGSAACGGAAGAADGDGGAGDGAAAGLVVRPFADVIGAHAASSTTAAAEKVDELDSFLTTLCRVPLSSLARARALRSLSASGSAAAGAGSAAADAAGLGVLYLLEAAFSSSSSSSSSEAGADALEAWVLSLAPTWILRETLLASDSPNDDNGAGKLIDTLLSLPPVLPAALTAMSSLSTGSVEWREWLGLLLRLRSLRVDLVNWLRVVSHASAETGEGDAGVHARFAALKTACERVRAAADRSAGVSAVAVESLTDADVSQTSFLHAQLAHPFSTFAGAGPAPLGEVAVTRNRSMVLAVSPSALDAPHTVTETLLRMATAALAEAAEVLKGMGRGGARTEMGVMHRAALHSVAEKTKEVVTEISALLL